ncbi:hypothetical protein K490DRAFT_63198 [Saccharata proteae CBS 121410]|uniref:Uncharacterized protein n=1 Tax=Saccharata proteae CBS 121410 TaxID=1314787 RepID=A0A9P4HW81_9PEZI|nr:hypothetical protein K490DRAFT_63198 [Saccharata proteae CBS 121410]
MSPPQHRIPLDRALYLWPADVKSLELPKRGLERNSREFHFLANYGHILAEPIANTDEGAAQPFVPGLTLYYALARQSIGDPQKVQKIRNNVLDHFLRAYLNTEHELFAWYRWLQPVLRGSRMVAIFDILSTPDMAPLPIILQIVADAIRAQIVVWTRSKAPDKKLTARTIINTIFDRVPTYHVLLEDNPDDRHFRFKFSTLVPDESGKMLLELLETNRTKKPGLLERAGLRKPSFEINRLFFWGEKVRPGGTASPSYLCHNDWKDDDNKKKTISDIVAEIPDKKISLCPYTINISDPNQIEKALGFLDETLQLAPGQAIRPLRKHPDGSWQPMKRFVGVDCEFVRRQRPRMDISEYQSHWDDPDNSIQDFEPDFATAEAKLLFGIEKSDGDDGNGENLVSVLSMAVDRHVVFSFYLLDMIEKADSKKALAQIGHLLRKTVFNPTFLKIWWNFQQDFEVLNATIAHMYQGTKRRVFMRHLFSADQGNEPKEFVVPTFKFGYGNKLYQDPRPADLCFPEDDHLCPLHPNRKVQRISYWFQRCPCSMGNVDLQSVFWYLYRHAGFVQDHIDEIPWWQARRGLNFDKLLDVMLLPRGYYWILKYLKDRANEWPRGSQDCDKDTFYASMKPGMEKDDDQMGYLVGDVIAVAVIFRYLVANDDRLG